MLNHRGSDRELEAGRTRRAAWASRFAPFLSGEPHVHRHPRIARPRLRRAQAAPARRLVLGRLRHSGHHLADHGREPVRGRRCARRQPGAGRGRRQRQRHAGRRAALCPRHLDRLRGRAARAWARACRRRAPAGDVSRGRRRSAALCRRPLRRGAFDRRRDVHAESAAGRRRAAARGAPRRAHRAGVLDARGLHRPGAQDRRPPPSGAARRSELAPALGHRGRPARAVCRPAHPGHAARVHVPLRIGPALGGRVPRLLRPGAPRLCRAGARSAATA